MHFKHAFLVFAFSLASISLSQAAPKLAYEKGGKIWVSDVDGKNAKQLTDGDWPDVSPDGTKVAFNTSGSFDKPSRVIAVADIETGKVTTFKNIPSDNCHSPQWSPDGKGLTFRILSDSHWNIGYINADDSGFYYVYQTPDKSRDFWTGCWAADGKSIFCQDMENLIRLGLDGKVLEKWEIAKVFPEGSASSGITMDLSPDGKHLLIDIEMGDGEERDGWEGPAPAIWKFDVESGKAERVTAVNHFAWIPNWLGNDEMIFISMPKDENVTSIYRGKIGGKEFERLFKDVFAPSVSQ